ncbi:hypothetical protein INH39_30590 [Massilia violaceinigra]|uniref:Uncharacterized protein n=1 Tax=Massilia violaceinigra TaxID=2045208 RepID=A0ABY4A4S8_9BURK|nr:hypothetical protein [Massilia violaceinigra]UOD29683.1 hypothetical protein INH39_30590 [Massilia violaceinigra]
MEQCSLSGSTDEGRFAGAYQPWRAPDASGLPKLDVTGLLSDDENDRYSLPRHIQTFSGIGYQFQNGYCIHEILFDRGALVADGWWIGSGLLVGFNLIGKVNHSYDWYSSGQLKSASVICGELFAGFLGFFENGRLRSLTLHGDFFSMLPDIAGATSFFPLKKRNDLAFLRGAENMYLSGRCVDNGVIELMANSGAFDATTALTINDATLGEVAVSVLSRLTNLKTLSIESPDAAQSAIAGNIKKLRPDINTDFIPAKAYSLAGKHSTGSADLCSDSDTPSQRVPAPGSCE